ncbi:hypothetical protein [Streptomyces hygroscopicus]|uniref:hypothetical protein n=1 Tax=Streptomyces hygroscopicus TaxID=1912 RepID=UPI000783E532|nr:hypothetical protein [Streptomyces hygroscopicus]
MDSIGDWYAASDRPGGDPSWAPNYYPSEDDDPIEYLREPDGAVTADQSHAEDPLACEGCGHTHPESLDENRLCPYCAP